MDATPGALAGYPWSGQEACFDSAGSPVPCAGSGQDGQYRSGRPWPVPRFQVAGGAPNFSSALALDRLTGLAWPRDAGAAAWPMTQGEAQAWVSLRNAENWLGHDDWRLPTRRELLCLASLAHARPALPPGHPFTNIFQHWHWTATPAASAPGHFWRVHLEGGRMFPGPGDARHMVLPVRGAGWLPPGTPELAALAGRPWPVPRFERAGQAVLDRLTGLSWLDAALPAEGEATWREALEAAARMKGWRLPTIWELESLVDASRAWPALPQDHPFGQGVDGAWSSTSSGYDHAWAWVLYFGKGAVGVGHKPGRHFKFLLTANG